MWFSKMLLRAWQAWEVCYMGSGGFFKKWAKVPESVDFTGFVRQWLQKCDFGVWKSWGTVRGWDGSQGLRFARSVILWGVVYLYGQIEKRGVKSILRVSENVERILSSQSLLFYCKNEIEKARGYFYIKKGGILIFVH